MLSGRLLVQAALKGILPTPEAYQKWRRIPKRDLFFEYLLEAAAAQGVELPQDAKRLLDLQLHDHQDQDEDNIWELWQDQGGGEAGAA